MIRHALKLASRLSPTFGRIVRDVHSTVGGSRFEDLKRHIDDRLRDLGSQAGGGAFGISLEALQRGAQDRTAQPELAFITNLPPDDTGIACCSYHSWLGGTDKVDLFCPASDTDWFIRHSMAFHQAAPDGRLRLLDVSTLLTANQIHNYKYIVIALGNSDHNLYIHTALRKIAASRMSDRCFAYIHDPYILNFVHKGLSSSQEQLVAYIKKIYKVDLAGVSANETAWAVHAELARRRILGLRYLREFGIRRFLVNSQAAERLVEADLAGTDCRIGRVFHPVFLPEGAEPPADGRRTARAGGPDLIVGTFGVPSGAKRMQQVIEAVRILNAGSHKVRLVVAGYGVDKFIDAFPDIFAGLDVIHHDGPTDAELINSMAGVDVAVQLRAQNTGESSGVVAQLLMLGRPVVVSATGSFVEFGDAVIQTRPDASSAEIAAAIIEAATAPPRPDAIRAYVSARSPERFRRALMQKLQEMVTD